MKVASPAKINLHLRIGPLAADGFHPLLSWMCTIGLSDTLAFFPSDKSGIKLQCERPDVPLDQSNLVYRAGAALDAHLGAIVELQKNIPIGGGLGGGSSNAAAALMGLNKFWNLGKSQEELSQIGAKLGSDVPFFFHAPSAICTGRGQFVRPTPAPRPKFAVLNFPSLSMATLAVYRRFDELKAAQAGAIEQEPDWDNWAKLSALKLLPLLQNDLEKPAFDLCPQLGEIRSSAERHIGRIVRMSGSGSTLFTLADDEIEATHLSTELQKLNLRCEPYALR
jgi:4-diphosphocytidyl-2-C-methyl-D-erythritol kinase